MNDFNTVNYTGWVLISLMVSIIIINFSVILIYSIKHKLASRKAKKQKQTTDLDQIVITVRQETVLKLNTSTGIHRAFASQTPRLTQRGPKEFKDIKF